MAKAIFSLSSLVAIFGLGAVTAAGLVHRSRIGQRNRSLSLALLIMIGVLTLGSLVTVAVIKLAGCECRNASSSSTTQALRDGIVDARQRFGHSTLPTEAIGE